MSISRIAIIGNMTETLILFRSTIIKEFIKYGHEVFAYSPDYNDLSREKVLSMGATPVDYSLARTGMNPVRDVLDIIRLYRSFSKLGIDTVLCYFIKPVVYGSLAARFAGVKSINSLIGGLGYVFTEGGEFTSTKRVFLRSLVSMMYWLAFRQNHTIFMQNPDDIAYFVDRNIVSSDKIVRINGSGVNLDEFDVVTPILEPITFTLVARLLVEKGVREYVNAARTIKLKYPQTRFLLLGRIDTNPGGISESEVNAWVSEGIVEWPGQVANVAAWLHKTSVFVLPSYREGTPRSSLEAMSTGLPIITTDAPGCRETVVDGLNGFLVPVKDSAALANAMLTFVRKPELLHKMGLESRRIAEERYDVNKVNHTIMKSMGLLPESVDISN
jgi:glycosyltransferase involved in cell wall biosynthesis